MRLFESYSDVSKPVVTVDLMQGSVICSSERRLRSRSLLLWLAAWRWLESECEALAERLWQKVLSVCFWCADLYTVRSGRCDCCSSKRRFCGLQRAKVGWKCLKGTQNRKFTAMLLQPLITLVTN